jgi:hypothetical protein
VKDDKHNRYVFADAQKQIHCVRPLGHQLLVRKCKHDEGKFLIGDAKHAKPVNSMPGWVRAEQYLERLTDWTPILWLEVLAAGDQCGSRRTDEQMRRFTLRTEERARLRRKYAIDSHIAKLIRSGDRILVLENPQHTKYIRAEQLTGNVHDYLIDESETLLLVRKGNDMDMIPMGNRVLVELKQAEEHKKGGVFIPETAHQIGRAHV